MKTNIETHFRIDEPFNGDWSFYILPTIWLNREKDNYFHGKQFVIIFGFLFWEMEIEFNEY